MVGCSFREPQQFVHLVAVAEFPVPQCAQKALSSVSSVGLSNAASDRLGCSTSDDFFVPNTGFRASLGPAALTNCLTNSLHDLYRFSALKSRAFNITLSTASGNSFTSEEIDGMLP